MSRLAERRGSLPFAGISAGCLGMCVAIGVLVRRQIPWLDAVLHDSLVRLRTDSVIAVARVVTQAGATTVIWPVIGIAALTFPRSSGPAGRLGGLSGRLGGAARWLSSAALAAAAGGAIGVRLLLSDAFRRSRPPAADWATTAGGFAYPSGHTTAATVGAGALAWAVTRHLRRRGLRVAIWSVGVLWSAVVGCSRMVLGVHWPTDVVGGWLLGAGWLIAMAAVARRLANDATGLDTTGLDTTGLDTTGLEGSELEGSELEDGELEDSDALAECHSRGTGDDGRKAGDAG